MSTAAATITKNQATEASVVEDAPALTDGFQLVIDALKLNDIENLYVVPGIPISDLLRMAQAEGMRVVSFRHEQNAGNAAAIAGFMTKKPGVCMTVSAPGFLNGLTALANATTNCFPMILISGSSEREVVDLQQGDYEEMDQLAIAKPLCKAAFRILHAQDIGIGVARAIRAAVSGRPGGVYLDLPAKLFSQVMDAAEGAKSLVKVVDPTPAQYPSAEAVNRALDLLKGAKRPLVIFGKGAAYAQADDTIRAFVEKSGIPFLQMSMAKGLLPDTHPQSAGAARSLVLQDADVVMLVGARLNWLLSHGKGKTWGKPGSKKFIQVDIEPREMDSNVEIHAPLVGDIASVMEVLLKGIEGGLTPPTDWMATVAAKREQNVAKMAPKLMSNASPMNFHGALGALRRIIKERPDAMLVNEGANTLDLARGIIDMYEPRKRLDVGTWGVMGVGMGYAVAAAVESGKPVLAVEGDSAFGFSGMEVETICRYNLPVCIVIFNNNGIYRGTDVNPTGGADPSPMVFVPGSRYDKMMEAFGGVGVHVTNPDELYRAVSEAMDSGRPTLVNAVIDPAAGTESGNIGSLNPTSSVRKMPS
ncbi:oxalyl-CoA decarboxylase [Azospirillum thiophilum]|uniref:Oxalyl-CoA decarboxylase n=1 Tax=Azospirillum thiophilum TaxID=528244 RepID=A0AAC8W1I5_9PROT|nr:oxalyl-CoA decarboxylase [Azospirillum thiophilum]ALG73454.1 oxalyl-CoA decarboxylase [Azospirillum thiophilum]KJR62846.1 oxalyl-CoA decarboxylase [Azospirillum thiophilum]